MYRPKEHSVPPTKDKSPKSKVSFDQENLIENKVDKIEQILTDKLSANQDTLELQLKLKEREAAELELQVKNLQASEESLTSELMKKNAEGVRLADLLAAQAKEQMDSVKVT